jgi:hypothetical protein
VTWFNRRVRALIWTVLVVAACSFKSGQAPDDGRVQDASPGSDSTGMEAPGDTSADASRCDDCVLAGGACNSDGTICTITTAGTDKVVCPAGLECHVNCQGSDDACKDGVDCTQANKCTILCNGTRACRDGDVQCNTNNDACSVTCMGADACGNHGITCGGGSCAGNCLGANACQSGGVICGPGACAVDCEGASACQNGTCPVEPASCMRKCCGASSCANNTCANCTVDRSDCP